MMTTMPQLRAERLARVRDAVAQAVETPGPIILGPWLGEIGFELLYWIPFLRWALAEAHLEPERLIVLSRGGCQSWYAGLANRYVELFDVLSPDELRVLNRERMAEQAVAGPDYGLHRGQMTAKQYGVTRVEREILRRVGFAGATLIHPSIMFALFRLYWRQRIRDLHDRCLRLVPIPKPPAPADLSEPYIAVKFYSSHACAERKQAAGLIRQMLALLAERLPVVVLDSGDRYDDHGAFPATGSRVTVRQDFEPRTNLAEQTALIAHASAFVGTYGGFAYLAPLLGVPTTALYAERTFRDDHLHLASRLFAEWGVPFDVTDLATGLAQLERRRRRPDAA